MIKLDCRSLEYKLFSFDMSEHVLVLVNTGVKHSLAGSEYNLRRKTCEKGVSILRKYYPNITHLRDVTLGMLDEHKEELGETVYKRCSYFVEENQRVDLACKYL